jgi:AcrR family transcriptional regulator
VSTSSTRPSENQVPDTRERVLEVASRLLASRGYSGTSISAISKASGVLPASIYWHFESKEGLAAAVVERAAERWLGQLRELSEAFDPSRDPGSEPFIALREVFEDERELVRLLNLMALERRGADSEAAAALRRVRSEVKAAQIQLTEPFIQVRDPALRRQVCERIAELFMMLIDGAFLTHQFVGEEADLDAMLWLLEKALRATARQLIDEAQAEESA